MAEAMKIEQAEQLVSILAASYPHTMISAETVMMYTLALRDCEDEEGSAIVLHWTATEKRWPSISELRTMIARARGETAPDFVAAWREVRAAFSLPEHRRKPWSHPAIDDAVNSIGMREIGQSDEPEIMRAQFERYYKAACERYTPKSTIDYQRVLVGEINKRSTIDGKPTKLLGGKS